MDLLQYGDSDEEGVGVEEESENNDDVKIRTWLTDDEDSDNDHTDIVAAATKKRLSNAKEKNMLSADELFAQNIEKPIVSGSKQGAVFEIRATTE
jgi:hypothetical protein